MGKILEILPSISFSLPWQGFNGVKTKGGNCGFFSMSKSTSMAEAGVGFVKRGGLVGG
jgi:hypothetical protein